MTFKIEKGLVHSKYLTKRSLNTLEKALWDMISADSQYTLDNEGELSKHISEIAFGVLHDIEEYVENRVLLRDAGIVPFG